MQDIASNPKIEKKFYSEEEDSFILKYRFQFPEGEAPSLSNATLHFADFVKDVKLQKPKLAKPYLETDLKLENSPEGIKTLNRLNLQKEMKSFPRNVKYCVVEVFSESCQACKRVEPQLAGLRKRLLE